MNMMQPPPVADGAQRPDVSTASLGSAARHLWPYIWPRERADLKIRIFGALLMLVVAKLVTIAVPYSFKWATDALAEGGRAAAPAAILFAPVAMTLLYAALRVAMALFTQLRDGLFAAVAMNAVRRLALDVFVHMHALSLRFHLERKTGGLTRVLERGRNAIETITRMVALTGVPTALEFVLILGVFLFQFDWRYALVTIMAIVTRA